MSSSRPPIVGPPGGAALNVPSSGDWRRGLGAIGGGTWLRAGAFGSAAALVIAVPTRLVPNGFFSRMTPTRPLDYVFLVVSSALLGLTLALRAARVSAGPSTATWSPDSGGTGTRAAAAGIGTVLAVGCPVCNRLVVALLGTGGALSIFAPLQPVIGLGAAGLLAVGLRHRLLALGAAACRRPAGPEGPGPSAFAGRLPGAD